MKWVILGSTGQLGAEFVDLLGKDCIGFSRQSADLANPDAMEQSICSAKPEGVINCAAYNMVDKAEDHPLDAFETNSWGPKQLAGICQRHGWKLIHFSTDHVFSGNRKKPWLENDFTVPANTYGLSKLAGEEWVRKTNNNSFIVRTCGLYGSRGRGGKGGNFVETMLRLAKGNYPIRVVSDQICNPSSAKEVAQATIQLVEHWQPGTYHLANSGTCSWHEFASTIMEIAGMDVRVEAIASSEFGSRACRPKYSALSSRWSGENAFPALRTWRDALADYLKMR